jgi:hypothetical protein
VICKDCVEDLVAERAKKLLAEPDTAKEIVEGDSVADIE